MELAERTHLLGLADDFEYGHGHDPQGQVTVQPNFEVVFLAPSPLAEAALARIAERRSRGTGAVFQITKKSVFAAAGGLPSNTEYIGHFSLVVAHLNPTQSPQTERLKGLIL